MNEPTTQTTSPAEPVTLLAREINAWQKAEGLTDVDMIRRYRGLGSDKTYRRLIKGDTAELNTEAWLTKYSAVRRLISSLEEDRQGSDADDILTLTGVTAVKRAFLRTTHVTEVNRLIFVEGDTGLGKTSIIAFLAAEYGDRFISLECMKAWNDNPNAFLGDLMLALGLPINADANAAYQKQRRVIEHLSASRACILLDEGHHLGPRCLDVLKALINRTPGEFILFAMGTLWNRLKQAAYEECRQLTGNRLAERVRLALTDRDISLLLTTRLSLPKAEAATATALLREPAAKHGNLRFIADVILRVRKAAKGTEATVELITAAATEELASR
jgi:DNA transposition AAA+ family ATPase